MRDIGGAPPVNGKNKVGEEDTIGKKLMNVQ